MKNGFWGRLIDRWRRHWLLLLGDIWMEVIGVYAAMLMRFAPILPPGTVGETTSFLPYLVLSYIGVFLLFGMYRVLWRYADAKQMVFLAFANIVGCGVAFLWNEVFHCGLSLYFLLIHFALSLASTCGIRLALRVVSEAYSNHRQKDEFQLDSHRLLIVGAGHTGSYVATQYHQALGDLGRPVAIVDDDKRKRGMTISGVPVRGGIDDIPQIVHDLGITDILIALPSVHGERLQEIISICKRTHCYVRLLPQARNVGASPASGRLVAREPDLSDFLSRPLIRLNEARMREFLAGRTVLITGGAGSVGSEIMRQMLPYAPERIVIFDISENYIAELQAALAQAQAPCCPIAFELGSVGDSARLDAVFAAHHPQIVFHAAAHKHVPLMETAPVEAVKNNIFGLENTLNAARRAGCETFIQLSSESAVNPVSVLGSSMQVAENLTRLHAERAGMRCFTVRFGNVLGSHGSILPLLVNQIHNGGPVTITNPEAERYFVTLPEAAQLILCAAADGENAHTYVLDMGSPLKIRDLTRRLIHFYGLEPEVDIPITVTGMHPGEKLYGEMYTEAEAIRLTQTANERVLGMLSPAPDEALWAGALVDLRQAQSDDEIVRLLQSLAPYDCAVQ